MKRTKLWDGALILLLLLAAFLFLGPVLWPGESEILIGSDLHWLFYPTTQFAFTAIQAGELPLWNPHLFLGFPQYAEPQLATFYPPLWLLALAGWPVTTAFSWLYAFHLGLTAAGGYLLLRRLGGQRAGAVVGGFTLGFSTFMLTRLYAGHLPHVMTIAYLPWLLAAADWAVVKRPLLPTIATTLIAALPLGLAILAGYAPFFPLLVGTLTLYLGWRAWLAYGEAGWRPVVRLAAQWTGLGLFAGLLAAVQLLPTLQFTLLSSRVATADYAFANQFALPFWQLLTLLSPDLFGIPTWYELPPDKAAHWAISYPPTYWEAAVYVGILPLLLYGLAWGLGHRSLRFWGFLGLAGLLLALGGKAAWHRLAYQVIPGFGLFRVPARMVYLFVLSTAVLAGLTFDHWFSLPATTFHLWRSRLQRMALFLLPALLLLTLLTTILQAGQTAVEPQLRLQGITDQLLRLSLFLLLSLALLLKGYGRPRSWLAFLALLILIADLWGFGSKFVATHSISQETGWTEAHAVLPPERHSYRVMSSGLPPNLAAIYGFHHTGGYDDFRTEAGLRLEELVEQDVRVAQLLGVRYHLHDPAIGGLPQTSEGWRYFTMLDGETIPVFEQVDALPRAFVVYDVVGAADEAESLHLLARPEIDLRQTAVVQILPDTQCDLGAASKGQVEILAYRPNQVRLHVETPTTGWLVLTDLYYPGWRAQVNGREVSIQATNYGLRGVCIPAGSHEVIFEFTPPLLHYGAVLSGGAWLLLLLVGLWWLGKGIVAAVSFRAHQRRRKDTLATK
jgi:hypothetical protein